MMTEGVDQGLTLFPAHDYPAAKSPITWVGAKTRIASWIIKHFPEHTTYVDVFGGSASVLLAKRPSPVEVYNDIDSSLVTLFRVLQNRELANALYERISNTPYSREEFNLAKEILAKSDNQLEIAWAVIVTQNMSYGGFGERWSYSVKGSALGVPETVRRFQTRVERLKSASRRLLDVQIEHDDWLNIIDRYDDYSTLFYIDPPYLGEVRAGSEYKHDMENLYDHEKLVTKLLAIKGMAVVSGYASDLYTNFEQNGWTVSQKQVVNQASASRSVRTEHIWVSQDRPTKSVPTSSSA